MLAVNWNIFFSWLRLSADVSYFPRLVDLVMHDMQNEQTLLTSFDLYERDSNFFFCLRFNFKFEATVLWNKQIRLHANVDHCNVSNN